MYVQESRGCVQVQPRRERNVYEVNAVRLSVVFFPVAKHSAMTWVNMTWRSVIGQLDVVVDVFLVAVRQTKGEHAEHERGKTDRKDDKQMTASAKE